MFKGVLKKEKPYGNLNKSLKQGPNKYEIKLLLSTSSSRRIYQLQIQHGKTSPCYKLIHKYPSFEDNACLKGRGILSPKCWAHSPYSVALYPIYGGLLHIIDVVLGLLVGLLVVIIHLCILYIRRRYFHLSKHSILSCLGYTSTLCKEVPPLKRIVIYLCYSLLRHILLSFGLFLLFLCYFWYLVA